LINGGSALECGGEYSSPPPSPRKTPVVRSLLQGASPTISSGRWRCRAILVERCEQELIGEQAELPKLR